MSRKYSKRPRGERFSLRLYLAAAILLLTALGTSSWTATTLARYVTSATTEGSASVAAFVVTAAKDGTQAETLTLTNVTGSAALTQDYKFTVGNGNGACEVATAYDVVVTLPEKLDGVALSLKNGGTAVAGTKSTDGKTYTFENAGVLPAGQSQSDPLTLTFTLTPADAVSGTYENIQITVNAAQVD